MPKVLFFTLVAGLLAACAPAPRSDVYVGGNGATTVLENDAQACVRACNNDYARCGDAGSTERGIGASDSLTMFGVDATCKQALKECLPRCKGR